MNEQDTLNIMTMMPSESIARIAFDQCMRVEEAHRDAVQQIFELENQVNKLKGETIRLNSMVINWQDQYNKMRDEAERGGKAEKELADCQMRMAGIEALTKHYTVANKISALLGELRHREADIVLLQKSERALSEKWEAGQSIWANREKTLLAELEAAGKEVSGLQSELNEIDVVLAAHANFTDESYVQRVEYFIDALHDKETAFNPEMDFFQEVAKEVLRSPINGFIKIPLDVSAGYLTMLLGKFPRFYVDDVYLAWSDQFNFKPQKIGEYKDDESNNLDIPCPNLHGKLGDDEELDMINDGGDALHLRAEQKVQHDCNFVTNKYDSEKD